MWVCTCVRAHFFLCIFYCICMYINIFFQILAALQPCTIITPLDCFWEGSKLLGPKTGIHLPYVYDFKYPAFISAPLLCRGHF